tara:strand:- start:1479 stop:2885 length:1407 start_codon:yes stop_codon:yes gene_type:complete
MGNQAVWAQTSASESDNLWYASPNVAVVSRLPFDTRYSIHLSGSDDFDHRVEVLRDMRPISHAASALQIEEEATAVVSGRDIGILARAVALPPNVPRGAYSLHGLERGKLEFNRWGGALGVRLINQDSTTAPMDLPVMRFMRQQFLRICIDGVLPVANASGSTRQPTPLIAVSVDNKLILRSAQGAPARPALWRRGCVDTVGRKVDVTLVEVAMPDAEPPTPRGPHRVTGRIFFADLSDVRAEVDLANAPFPYRPPSGSRFSATWSSSLRQSVIASDLPEPRRYLLTMDASADGTPANMRVSTESGMENLQLHDGGGLAMEAAGIRLEGLPTFGTFTLLGYGGNDFSSVQFAVEGNPRHANSYMPTNMLARFDQRQFVRLCVDRSLATGDSFAAPEQSVARRPHLVPFRDGQPLGPSGRIAAMDAGCTDFVACSIDAGMLGDKLVQGNWRMDATLHYRPLQGAASSCP